MSTATFETPVTQAQVTKDEADILAVLETLRQAHHNKDGAAIAALYAPDAAYFSLAPPLTHHGINREEKQAWLDSWATPVEIEPRDFNLTISGDFAFGHGFLRLTGTKKGAEGKVDFWMRQTVHLQRQGSSWRIIHDHASVPFYMDGTLRPAFDLKP
jgi:ketosteroid isomerase-like protein